MRRGKIVYLRLEVLVEVTKFLEDVKSVLCPSKKRCTVRNKIKKAKALLKLKSEGTA